MHSVTYEYEYSDLPDDEIAYHIAQMQAEADQERKGAAEQGKRARNGMYFSGVYGFD